MNQTRNIRKTFSKIYITVLPHDKLQLPTQVGKKSFKHNFKKLNIFVKKTHISIKMVHIEKRKICDRIHEIKLHRCKGHTGTIPSPAAIAHLSVFTDGTHNHKTIKQNHDNKSRNNLNILHTQFQEISILE